jgi:predicted metal-dependent enzyme (double-stranded beta helix superfamily)
MAQLEGAVAPTPTIASLGAARLAEIVLEIAGQPGRWASLVRYTSDWRWYRRLALDEVHEIWLLSWLPGQRTGFHDHGPSDGAFTVVRGVVSERTAAAGRPARPGRFLRRGAVRSFGPGYVHDVGNDSAEPAVSIHAYSPPLSCMRRYEMVSGILQVTGEERAC